ASKCRTGSRGSLGLTQQVELSSSEEISPGTVCVAPLMTQKSRRPERYRMSPTVYEKSPFGSSLMWQGVLDQAWPAHAFMYNGHPKSATRITPVISQRAVLNVRRSLGMKVLVVASAARRCMDNRILRHYRHKQGPA